MKVLASLLLLVAEASPVIHAGGTVEPVGEERLIVAESAGRIARIHVVEGERVAKGQLIAEIAAEEAAARVAVAERQIEVLKAERALLLAGQRPEERRLARARWEAAEAARARAEGALARAEALAARGLLAEDAREERLRQAEVAQAEARAAEAAYALAEAGPRAEELALLEARIGLAEAELAAAQAALAKTRIRSPLDGTILKLLLREGELVAPSIPSRWPVSAISPRATCAPRWTSSTSPDSVPGSGSRCEAMPSPSSAFPAWWNASACAWDGACCARTTRSNDGTHACSRP